MYARCAPRTNSLQKSLQVKLEFETFIHLNILCLHFLIKTRVLKVVLLVCEENNRFANVLTKSRIECG